MYCCDCGRHISQEEYLENDGLCYDCFEELIAEVMDETETD